MTNTPTKQPNAEQTTYYTIADVAAKLDLKNQGEDGVYCGKNPIDGGEFYASENGFFLYSKGQYAGMGYDRKADQRYTSIEIAAAADIPYEQYEASQSHPTKAPAPSSFVPLKAPKQYDTRTLEDRGLNRQAAQFWQISGARGLDKPWGESRKFPTFHPDGSRGRARIKWRYPAKQLQNAPDKDPAKITWDNYSKAAGEPNSYGIHAIAAGQPVWLVNGELAVWLFWQEGIAAICPFGERRSEKTYRDILQEVKDAGASRLCVMLDNDATGHQSAMRAKDVADQLKIPQTVYDLGAGTKKGYDASDLWEFYNRTARDGVTFQEFLESQLIATPHVLEQWDAQANAEKRDREKAKADAAARKLEKSGLLKAERDESVRKCPHCHKFAVIVNAYKPGFLCWKKKKGCGESFAASDPEIAAAEVQENDGDVLLELFNQLKLHQLFKTEAGENYISVIDENGKKTFETDSVHFARWIRHAYLHEHNRMIKSDDLKLVMDNVTATAAQEGPIMKSHIRSAYFEGRIYVDLCNEFGEVVEINTEGWHVTNDYPVFFQRPAGMLPLPYPAHNEDNEPIWNEFKALVNYGNEDNWRLIIAWMMTAICPFRWPCPILSVHGEQGSAKSWMIRLCRRAIDPSKIWAQQGAREERDVSAAMNNTRVFALDNVSKMENWLSDLLASAVTGAAKRERKLHSNKEEVLFEAQPAVIINGIPDKIGGTDFRNRSLSVFLPKIHSRVDGYRTEEEISDEFDKLHPFLLGAICDALVTGLRNRPRRRQLLGDRLPPRMADFSMWILCCADALPFTPHEFWQSYLFNMKAVADLDIEGIFPQSVCAFISKRGGSFMGKAETFYQGVKHEALTFLANEIMAESDAIEGSDDYTHQARRAMESARITLEKRNDFPKLPNSFSAMITRIAPSLERSQGISCVKLKRSADGSPWEVTTGPPTNDGRKELGAKPKTPPAKPKPQERDIFDDEA